MNPAQKQLLAAEEGTMEMARDRRYTIQSHDDYGFYTGITPIKEQILMGLYCPNLIALRFDIEGNLLCTEKRPIPFFQEAIPPYNIYDKRISPLIEAWKKEIHFRKTMLTVKKFFSEEHGISIEDYPSYFYEILDDPNESDEEKAEVRDSMKSWNKDGQFVLHWGNDYWLSKTGKVVSS